MGSSSGSSSSSSGSSSSSSSSSSGNSNTQSFDELKTEFESFSEYQDQYGLAMVKASSAYARGSTGEGIVIGVTDSGLDTTHEEIGFFKLASGSQLNYSNYTPNTRQKRHGTMVAGIAAGRRNGQTYDYSHGVAFDAEVFFIAIQLAEPDENYDPIDLGDSSGDSAPDYSGIDNFFDQLFEVFKSNDVDVINNSYGFSGNINDYTEVQVRNAFPKTIAAMAQEGVPDYDKTIFVWSAGNAGSYADQGADFSSPEVMSGMAYFISELQGNVVAVAAVDENGFISDFSNRCGVSEDFCIAAPGGGITVAYPTSTADPGIYESTDNCVQTNSCYAVAGGTSFAAPHVAGGLALLSQHFDGQLGNTEILDRLFQTADKSGRYADSHIYGQGLMDLDAATMPVGQTSIATINSLTTMVFPTSSTSVGFVGSLVGDGLSGSLNKNFIILDELGAPFYRNLKTTSINALPSLESLSYHYTNPSLKVQQVNRELADNAFLTLGLNQLNYGEYELAPSLWAKEKEKVNYFAFKKYLSNESFYFLGQGINPSIFLGFNQDRKLLNQFFGNEENASPFLNFAKEGSFLGAGRSLTNRSSISGAFFSGKHPDLVYFPNHNKKSSGLVFEYQTLLNKQELSFQSGVLSESSAMLGSSFKGAYGRLDDTLTYFSGLNSSFIFSNFRLMGSYFYGMSKPNLDQVGMVKDISTLTSSSFNLTFYKTGLFGDTDSFGFSISQPLKLESGEINFSLPYRRTVKKEILFNEFTTSMRASGRQVDMEFIYSTPLRNGYLKSRIGLSKDQGHISSDELQPFFETSWEFMTF
tara:strand:+ start:561 stop:2990 length:2430 start_codon:yes stop_codon:yes gene_type:complete